MVVAEVSANHGGTLDGAVRLIDEAAAAGASAVKIQTYSAGSMTLPSNKPAFQISGASPWKNYSTLWDLYSRGATPRDWHRKLFEAAERNSIPIFSSPFSPSDVEFLESLGCPAYKIASPEIGYVQLLDAVAETQKPIILSTGVATFEDIEFAIARLRACRQPELTVLKCTSAYPSPLDQQNLLTMGDMKERWSVMVGYSDHTASIVSGAAAVALGASVVEKHFSGQAKEGLDAFFSLNSQEFNQYVNHIREVEALRGSISYEVPPCAIESRGAMRSLYFKRSLPAGRRLTPDDVAVIRPSGGLPPRVLDDILGSRLAIDVEQGIPVTPDHLEIDSN